jgi:hypothetical protein
MGLPDLFRIGTNSAPHASLSRKPAASRRGAQPTEFSTKGQLNSDVPFQRQTYFECHAHELDARCKHECTLESKSRKAQWLKVSWPLARKSKSFGSILMGTHRIDSAYAVKQLT